MNDFVNALTHVHCHVDTDNQWKRAVESLGHMSNMDIALAWLDLSKYAVSIGNQTTVAEFKVLYRRVLRENEQVGTTQTCCVKHNTSDASAEIAKLTKSIRALYSIILGHQVRRNDVLFESPEPSDPTYSSPAATSRSSVDDDDAPSRRTSVSQISSRPATAPPAQMSAEMVSGRMDADAIAKCCKKMEGMQASIREIREAQLRFMAKSSLHYADMTGYVQAQDALAPKLDSALSHLSTVQGNIQQLLDRPDCKAELDLLLGNHTAQILERFAGLVQPESVKSALDKIAEDLLHTVNEKLERINDDICEGLNEQTAAIQSHENQTVGIVEQTEKTLKTILEVLNSHEASTLKATTETEALMKSISEKLGHTDSEATDLKELINERMANHTTSIGELKLFFGKTMGDFTEMLKLLLDIQKQRRSNASGTTAAGKQRFPRGGLRPVTDEQNIPSDSDSDEEREENLEGDSDDDVPRIGYDPVSSMGNAGVAATTSKSRTGTAVPRTPRTGTAPQALLPGGKTRSLRPGESALAGNPRDKDSRKKVSEAVQRSGREFVNVPGAAAGKTRTP